MSLKATIGSFYNIPRAPVLDTRNKALVMNTLMGVEVELENAGEMSENLSSRSNNLWSIEEDGSLREGGVEFKSRRPMSGTLLLESLAQLESAALAEPPSISPRTSVHVHMDCRRLDKDKLFDIIINYLIWEPVLFKTFAPSRINNHFCLPVYNCNAVLDAISRLPLGFESFHTRVHSSLSGRYTALNFRSLSRFGSLEFRHHPGCFSASDIRTWINAILALRRQATLGVDYREKYFYASSHGYYDQMMSTFSPAVVDRIKEAYGDVYNTTSEFNRDVIIGIRCAQLVLTNSGVL